MNLCHRQSEPATRWRWLQIRNVLQLILVAAFLSIGTRASIAGELIENPAYDGPKTTIKWAFWGGDETIVLYRQVCEWFVTQHPDIAIDLAIYPWGQYWTKLQTQVASGLAPDVISIWGVQAGVWINHGALLPLDALISDSDLNIDNFFPVTLQNFNWNGSQFAFPLELVTGALVYNIDRLEERGLTPEQHPSPTVPLKWDEYVALGKQLTLRDADGNVIQYANGSAEGWNEVIYALNGADFFNRRVNPSETAIVGNEALLEGVIEAFRNKYGDVIQVPEYVLRTSDYSGDTILRSNRFAMAVQGPWTLPKLRDMGVRFGLTPIPYRKAPHMLVNVNGVGIYVESRHPEEAWQFIQFLASQRVQEKIGSQLRATPVLRSAVPAFLNNDFGIPDMDAFIAHLDASAPYLSAASSDVVNAPTQWAERLEVVFEDEYNRRLAALQNAGTRLGDDDLSDLAEGMNDFIDKTVRNAAPQLETTLRNSFAQSERPGGGFWVSVGLPAVLIMFFISAFLAYLVWVRRTRTVERTRAKYQNAAGLLMLSPWLIGLIFFTIGPILIAVYLSFTEWNMVSAPEWVGAQQYLDLISDRNFGIGLERTFRYAAFVIPISMVGGILTAALLTSDVRGSDSFKAIFYFPSLFTGAAAAVLWINMFHREYGVVNKILGYLGMDGVNWLAEQYAFTTVILMNFFWVGGATLIYYAGMKQIPRSLYEAAEMDGAGLFRRFFKITLPMLSPVILFMVVVTTIGAFQVFTPALFFARDSIRIGEPGDALRFYSVNIYHEAFNNLQMGKACALAVVLFGIIFLITMVQIKLSKRFVHQEVH